MFYKFSPKLKMASIALLIVGVLLYAIGLFMYQKEVNTPDYVLNTVQENLDIFIGEYPSEEYLALNPDMFESGSELMHHWENQAHNRPWAAFFVAAFYAFAIAIGALFFLAILFASNSGWPIVISRVMEGVATFIPIGGVLVLIVIFGAWFGGNHFYHWMDPALTDPNSDKFDVIIYSKAEIWLNSGWIYRSVLYVVLYTLFMIWIKRTTKKMDENPGNRSLWEKLFRRSVIFVVVFALTSMAMAWDWIMSMDPHWYSTVFMWYGLMSYLVGTIAVIAIISIYLNKRDALPKFNDNHQHDLAKYIYAFSLVWTYMWFIQYMLQWYANVPEEVQYWQQRSAQYPYYFWMLVPNFLLVLLVFTSSSIKRVAWAVLALSFMVIAGHYWDFYGQIMPATVGGFHGFGLMEIGSLAFVSGLFIYVVFQFGICKLDLEPKGNPYFHESEIYEYPY